MSHRLMNNKANCWTVSCFPYFLNCEIGKRLKKTKMTSTIRFNSAVVLEDSYRNQKPLFSNYAQIFAVYDRLMTLFSREIVVTYRVFSSFTSSSFFSSSYVAESTISPIKKVASVTPLQTVAEQQVVQVVAVVVSTCKQLLRILYLLQHLLFIVLNMVCVGEGKGIRCP
ncbi:hypothetical protein X798_04563 [Onchocerca flexuosa]|uniref:Uncharacterized protein n=1 Tax=Onchocerca flexuosa TaxID=387005 RepID=A0A238BSU3_9BILA|nr:hypothetical protein X798_04563 [Onchocerca flexuosa]